MNDSLDGALRSAASTIEIPPGDLDRVVWRGASRARRNKRFARGGTTLAVILSLLAAVNVFGSRDDSVGVQVGTAGAVRGDIAIDWARQEAPALGWWEDSVQEVSGALYALSTAPGETAWNGQRVVWHSGDGLDWSPRERPGDLYMSDLSASGDRLYALGTTPATARTTRGKQVADPVVAWSEDGAQTWQRTRLPIDMESIAARSSAVVGFGGRVAASERGVVTVTKVIADPDISTLLPQGTDASNGWVSGPTGIDILKSRSPNCPSGTQVYDQSPERGGRVIGVPCHLVEKDGDEVVATPIDMSPQEVFGVAATYTWDDLHVGDDLRQAVLGVPMLSRAGDDGTFTPVDGVLPDDTLDATVIPASDGTFVLFATMRAGVQVWTSAEGASWQSAQSASRLEAVYSAGWVGDRLALLGAADAEGAIGLVVGLPTEGWHEVELREIAGIDASVPSESLWASMSSTTSSAISVTIGHMGSGNSTDSHLRLLVSRDGVTWSATSLDQLVGAPVEYASAANTSRGPIVSATLKGTSPDKPGRRVLLRGTYR